MHPPCNLLFVGWLSFLMISLLVGVREQWQAECVKVLDSPRYWDECQQTLPETAEALRVTLSIMSGMCLAKI